MEPIVVLIGLMAPVLYALARIGGIGREAYLFNSGSTTLGLTLASVVCGNIGVGTFRSRLVLFAAPKPGDRLCGGRQLRGGACPLRGLGRNHPPRLARDGQLRDDRLRRPRPWGPACGTDLAAGGGGLFRSGSSCS